jgi:hypothetical protein
MRDPILEELRRVRRRHLKELKRDIHREAIESNELLHKICDVVILPTGEQQFVASAAKMYEVLIAPKLRMRSTQR